MRRVRRERRRPLEGGRRTRGTAAPERPAPGLLELGGNVSVRADGGGRPVPDAPLGVIRKHLCQRGMRGVALTDGCRLVNRRPDKGMREAHTQAVGLDESHARRGHEIIDRRARALDGFGHGQQLLQLARLAHRRSEEQGLRRGGQVSRTRRERLLEACGQREAVRGQLNVLPNAQAVNGRQFEKRQRVAYGVAEQPLAQRRCEGRKVCIEELPGGFLRQAVDVQLGQTRLEKGALVAFAGGGQKDDRIGVNAPTDEGERIGGRPVEPMCILDQQRQRLTLRGVREQPERREPDQERFGVGGWGHPECRTHGVALDRGKAAEPVENRS